MFLFITFVSIECTGRVRASSRLAIECTTVSAHRPARHRQTNNQTLTVTTSRRLSALRLSVAPCYELNLL